MSYSIYQCNWFLLQILVKLLLFIHLYHVFLKHLFVLFKLLFQSCLDQMVEWLFVRDWAKERLVVEDCISSCWTSSIVLLLRLHYPMHDLVEYFLDRWFILLRDVVVFKSNWANIVANWNSFEIFLLFLVNSLVWSRSNTILFNFQILIWWRSIKVFEFWSNKADLHWFLLLSVLNYFFVFHFQVKFHFQFLFFWDMLILLMQ